MKKRNVSILSGGGGASLNRLYNGRDIIVINNYWCGSGDNLTKPYRQHQRANMEYAAESFICKNVTGNSAYGEC